MTKLSVNINKIALLRNARGRDFPNVIDFSSKCIDFGAEGITLHPRQDQRHARYADVYDLKKLCDARGVELNVEGYPSEELIEIVLDACPRQCTLVPDAPGQITSDHGWDIAANKDFLSKVIAKLKENGIRSSLFMDYDYPRIEDAREIGADRIELYTEPYAEAFGASEQARVIDAFGVAAANAQQAGLGVNAGHDLDSRNLSAFLSIPQILEVSIGHALVTECLDHGLAKTMQLYLAAIENSVESDTAAD